MQDTSRRSARTGRPQQRGRGRLLRLLAIVGIVPALLAGALTPSTADAGGTASRDPGLRLDPDTGGVLAEYNGRTIDLSLGWEGAETCVEQDDGGFACYDDDRAYRAAEGIRPLDQATPLASGAVSCTDGHFCLWDNKYFHGRIVQFKSAKTFYLDRLGFRNRANSMYNNRPMNWVTYMFDVDTGKALIPVGTVALPALSDVEEGRPSGTWNDKIDKIRLHNDERPAPDDVSWGVFFPGLLSQPGAVAEESRGALAEYNGRTIDLSLGWEGAETCVEQDDGGFVCYDDDRAYREAEGLAPRQESEASTLGSGDCARGYVCLWDAKNFGGRKVQFKTKGTHDLSKVSFRNRANTIYNARSSNSHFRDDGKGFGLEPRFATPALSKLPHFDANKTFNNKIDSIELLPQ